MSDLGDLIVKYSADLSDWSSNVSQVKSDLSSTADSAQASGSGILGGFGKAIGGALSFGAQVGQTVIGIKGLASGAIGLASALLQPAATAETTELSFETLLHSTKAAKEEMQSLNTFAAGTPMQTQWVDSAAAKLLAFGFNVRDVQPDITAIGDSLSGLGKLSDASLGSIVDIFGKVQAAGKLTGGDMMQLSNWGIPAWKALSEAIGKPIPVLQKMVSSGLIPAKEALPALQSGMEKIFGGGMAKQANTFTGLLSTLQSNWQIMMASLAGPALKVAEEGLSGIGAALASPAFQDFATGAGQAIANAFSSIGGLISSTVVPAFHALQPVAQQFISYFQSDQFAGIVADFQTVGNQIGRIAGDFQQATGPANNLVNGALSSLPVILEGIFQAADDVIFPLGQFLLWMQEGSPWAEVVKDGLIGIGVAFAAIQIGSFIATIPALVGGFLIWAGAAWTAAVATIAATWPILAIGAAIAIVVAGIILAVQHWGQIVDWLKSAWSDVVGFFATIWNGVVHWFESSWSTILNIGKIIGAALLIVLTGPFGIAAVLIATHIEQIKGFFSNLGSAIHEKATQAGDSFKQGFQNVGNWFEQQGKNITQGAQQVAQGAVDAGNWMYQHNTYWKLMVDGITAEVTAAKTWLSATWNDITAGIVVAWTWLSTTAVTAWNDVTQPIIAAVTTVVSWLTDKWNTVTGWISGQWLKWSTLAEVYFTMISVMIQARIWEAITWITDKWTAIHTWITDKWNALEGLAQGAWDRVVGVFEGIWNRISSPLTTAGNNTKNWFGSLASDAFNWGANIIQGIINGIGSMFSNLGNAASKAAGVVGQFLGFHSPAKQGPGAELDVWGPNLVKGFAAGIDQSTPILTASVNHLMAVGTYPIRPSTSAVASSVAGSSSGASGGGNQTIIVQFDTTEVARVVQKRTDELVRLKLGPKGRVA